MKLIEHLINQREMWHKLRVLGKRKTITPKQETNKKNNVVRTQ